MDAETKKLGTGSLFVILFILAILLLCFGWWLYKMHGWNLMYIGEVGVIGNLPGHLSVGKTPLELHQILFEDMRMVQVSASILTAGIAIAGSLYLSAWQSLSDSLFQALERARDTLKIEDVERTKRYMLERELVKAHYTLDELETAVVEGRSKFRFALMASGILLIITMFIG